VQQSLTHGGKVSAPQSAAAGNLDEIGNARLSDTVSMRGIRIGKVIIPVAIRHGDSWRAVERADIALQFDGPAERALPAADNPFNRMLSRVAVNWQQARDWAMAAPERLGSDSYDPFSQSDIWVKISTRSNGVYAIDRTDLATAGIDVAAIDPAGFRVFTLGGRNLPTQGSAPRDSLAEMAIAVFDDDGVFAGTDMIMFYGTGPDFWSYDDGFEFNHHPYSNLNVYYLTWGGEFDYPPLRMETPAAEQEPPATTPLTEFTDHIRLEEDNVLGMIGGDVDHYFYWYYWTDNQRTLNFNLPEGVAGAEHAFTMRVVGTVNDLRLNNSSPLETDSISRPFFHYSSDQFQEGLNQLEVEVYEYRNRSYTDYIEIFYRCPLTMSDGDELVFFAPESTPNQDVLSYEVSGVFASPYLIDITDRHNQKLIEYAQGESTLSFSRTASEHGGRHFILAGDDNLLAPVQVVVTEVDDLRSPANQADLILITHADFSSQALSFADYREQNNGLATRVVRIGDIYAQFSGGLPDPVAIRDFLGYTFRNWSGGSPSYCLLIGDGVYDFRDNLGIGAVNYIPPYIVANDESVSDENFAYFDEFGELDTDNSFDTLSTPIDRGVDMVVSRWPISSVSEFGVIAEKMERYEAAANQGRWRNLITLVADDENHDSGLPERQHTEDSEELADGYISPSFDLNKIYAVDYPFGVGGQKPEVREAIIRAFNNGTLIVNYVGHGNLRQWADEKIFRRVEDIPRLQNEDQLPLVFNASCSIGFFDDPLQEGMAEDFLSYASGGAIGTVSATRLVYSRPNAEYNKTTFLYLLGDYDLTIAEAMFVAKLVRQDLGQETNDRKYIYIGDPLTKLGFAPLTVEFETLAPDSLVALTVTEVAGVVKSLDGEVQSDFTGTAEISVFDNERTRSFYFPPLTDSVTYTEYGPEIYRGKVDVTNGRFDLQFVVPKDISYGGRNARLSCYASGGNAGASGSLAPIAIGGINTEVIDTIGPEIVAYFDGDPAKGDGAIIDDNSRLIVELFDSLGINLSGEVGHAIELRIDDDPAMSYELNDSFAYEPGSYQSGSATTTLPELAEGDHILKIKAWDSANNSSQLSLSFTVGGEREVVISELLCYPNPVVDDCEFSYYLSDRAEDVVLKIFTLSGLEIYSRSGLPGSAGYNGGVDWDGRDADGDRLANGVYLFQVSVRTSFDVDSAGEDDRTSATEKLLIMK
jgi:hypothetical protein